MISPPPLDLAAGLMVYATGGPRVRAKLREIEDDFRVEEMVELDTLSEEQFKGSVPVYRVEKRGIDTPHMMKIMEGRLKSRATFAGLKDKRATATQYVSAKSSRAESPAAVEHQLFRAEKIGFARRPIGRDVLRGNKFTLVLKGAGGDIGGSIDDAYAKCRERAIPNFFGYQRFGLKGMINQRIGREIVRRNFRDAVMIILGDPREGEGSEAREARKLAAAGRYAEARSLFTASQDMEMRILGRILSRADDYLAALRSVPIGIRRLFLHAYQSYLFNIVLSKSVASALPIGKAESGDNWAALDAYGLGTGKVHGSKESPYGDAVPLVQLVGYSYRDYGSRFDTITREVLRDEEVNPKLFYIKEAEEMSSEGGFRHAPLLAQDLTRSVDGDVAVLGFTLGRGEYATVLAREIVKPENPIESGF